MTTPQQVVLGGTDASTMINAIELNRSSLPSPTNAARSDRFWASRKANMSSAIKDVFEVNFASAGLVNILSFDAAHYPQTIVVEYTDADDTNWRALTDSITKRPLVMEILNSIPAVLPDPSLVRGHFHPQHDYDNHWIRYEVSIDPVKVQKLRFVMQRNPQGLGPVDISGNGVAYSLALQNINTGYQVASEEDIPFSLDEPDSPTSGEVFANSSDLFGSNLGFSKKNYHARNLTLNTDDDAPYLWRCRPQPFANAVVNFYADVRDSRGNAQVVDEIEIDPLYIGPRVNLYFSNDDVTAPFASARVALPPTRVSFSGVSIVENQPLSFGEYGDAAYMQVDNTAIGFEPAINWWMGIEWTRNWSRTADANNHTLFECDVFKVYSDQDNIYLELSDGSKVCVPNTTVRDVPIAIVTGCFDKTLYISVAQNGVWTNSSLELTTLIPSLLPEVMSIGANLDQTDVSNGTISAFVLKQEALETDDFWEDPAAYSNVPLVPRNEDKSRFNALLRLDTGKISNYQPSGLIGGPGFAYENMNWTPVPRNYEMQRGIMKLPVTKAKFWNFEITSLRPAINEKVVPITTRVRMFPPYLYDTANGQTSDTPRQSPYDLPVQVSMDQSSNYVDIPQFTGTGGNASGISNTEVFVADDYQTGKRLADASTAWRYKQFHPDRVVPRFNQSGPHEYAIQDITQTENLSFFAGFRRIKFYRSVLTAPQNHPVIEEEFIDNQTVSDGNWITTETGLWSGDITGPSYARTTSTVMPTQSGLRGLQFATHQSDAQILSVKGNFADKSYDPNDVNTWTASGDAQLLGLRYNPSLKEYALVVSRDANGGFWADIPLNFGPTYGDIRVNSANYADLMRGTGISSYEGGVRSETVPAPYGGRLHATARVTASEALQAPLWVQIVDADTGAVLTEAESNVSKNEIKKWYTSIDVRDFGARLGRTYGELENKSINLPSFSEDFARPNAPNLGRLPSGQKWHTPDGYDNFQIVSNKASNTPLIGECRSEVDTITPWGTLTVRISAIQAGATPAPVLDLGGITLMTDGSFQDENYTTPLATLGETLSTAHDYQFTFMLTKSVPSGHLPGGVDESIQPFSIVVSTGAGATWLQTICTSKAITSIRALRCNDQQAFGDASFTKFAWVPADAQYDLKNFINRNFSVDESSITLGENQLYSVYNNGRKFDFKGVYTYTDGMPGGNQSILAESRDPGRTLVVAPAGLSATPAGSGGSFAAGTYYYVVSSTNDLGESTATSQVSAVVVNNGTITLNWTAATGASNYNIYRGNSGGPYYQVGSSGGTTSYVDFGDDSDGETTPVTYNSTAGGGQMMITDVGDQFGALRFKVTQVPNGMALADLRIAYLDYNPTGNVILTLRGNGQIVDEISGTVVAGVTSLSPTAGSLSIRYMNPNLMSAAFKTAHPSLTAEKAIMIFQGSTFITAYNNDNAWTSTVRGIGGGQTSLASNGTTKFEGFNWNPEGYLLQEHSTDITYGNVSYEHTRTYGDMMYRMLGSTQNLAMKIVQKTPSNDTWSIQDATLFWDPVVWEFSCDGGDTWWEAQDIRNNTTGVLLFPFHLENYTKLKWRLTSYAGRIRVSHLAIRPWYYAQHGYQVPAPTHLPQGPNLVPADDYGPIERDPRWQAWDKPIPRWWWNKQ